MLDEPDDIYDFNLVEQDLEPSILPPEHTIREEINNTDTESDNDGDSGNDVNAAPTSPPTDIPNNGRSASSQKHYNLRTGKDVNYALNKMGQQYFQMTKIEYPEYKHIKSSKKRAKLNRKKSKGKVVIKDIFKKICALCFNQMSAKKGIQKHGQIAVNAILKEYTQLHDLGVFKPRFKNDLTGQ